MRRFIWILRAYLYMQRRAGFASWDICASLHESYADAWGMSPAEAVDEDISYWGE